MSLKTNIIKEIYPDEYNDSLVLSDDIIEKIYKKDNIYLNGVEVPDTITNINVGHGFSSYLRTNPNTENDNINNISYTTSLISSNKFNLNHLNTNYHKLLFSKDIDWENSYLKYAEQTFNELEQPIEYYEIDPTTGEKINEQEIDSYLYYSGIPTHINNSYELYTIIDYLLLKYKSLRFMLKMAQNQKKNLEEYNMNQNNS